MPGQANVSTPKSIATMPRITNDHQLVASNTINVSSPLQFSSSRRTETPPSYDARRSEAPAAVLELDDQRAVGALHFYFFRFQPRKLGANRVLPVAFRNFDRWGQKGLPAVAAADTKFSKYAIHFLGHPADEREWIHAEEVTGSE